MQYRVKGLSLTADGKPFNFFGVNLTGLEGETGHLLGMWTKLTHEDYAVAIKGQGFNGVRIPLTSSTLRGKPVPNSSSVGWYEPNNHMMGWDSRKMFTDLLDKLDKHDLKYVIDWHYLEEGTRPGTSIPALWYTQKYTDSDWLKDLVDCAQLMKGRKGAVGIDLKNEPDGGPNGCTWGDGNIATDWKMAAERAFQAIDQVNQDIIVIVEWLGQGSGLDYMVAKPVNIPRDRYCLSVHLYGPSTWEYEPYKSLYASSEYPFNMVPHWDKQWGNVARKELVFVGEYGSFYDTGRQKAWLDMIVKYMADNGIGGFTAYWVWGPDSNDTGGILAGGNYRDIRQDKVAALEPLRKMIVKAPEVSVPEISFPEWPKPAPEKNTVPRPREPDEIDLSQDSIVGKWKQMKFGGETMNVGVQGLQGDFARVLYLNDSGQLHEILVHKKLLN